jgi:hypothetical protein
MLLAAAAGLPGRHRLLIGLDEENIRRLRNDMPILRPLDEVPGLEGWDLVVVGPEDMVRLLAAAGHQVDGPRA